MPDAAPHPAPPSSVLVVGGGLAGAQTVAGLRAHGFSGRITLLGDEGVAPYDRPPLSKELLTRRSPVVLADDLGIDLTALADARLDDPAIGLDLRADGVTVTTRSGRLVHADAVVLALGSRPIRPAGWESAHLLHTAADADRLRAVVDAGRSLAIVGAGWVGAEVAGVAAGAGCDVTVVEAGLAPLARQVGDDVGRLLAGWYADAGVRLVTGATVTAVDDAGLTLADGERVAASAVLAAVGARPATDWLRGTLPLGPRGSLLVDRTGALLPADLHDDAPHPTVHELARLWAVGDCATREHPAFGAVPGGHWSAALHDPDATVRAMLGVADPPSLHAPYVFSQQLGHDLALVGAPNATHDVVLRGTPGDGPWSALYVERDESAHTPPDGTGLARLAAVLIVDRPRDVGGVRRLLSGEERPVVDLARASDPGVRWRDVVAG